MSSTVLEILQEAVGLQERRARLQRMATWTDKDLVELEETLVAQRAARAHSSAASGQTPVRLQA